MWVELPGLDAVEAARRVAGWGHLAFLDSARGGRYSYVSADPVAFHSAMAGEGCFDLVAQMMADFRLDSVEGLPPFQGGILGQFGYGLGHEVEVLPRPRFDEFCIPDLAVGVYDWVLAFDQQEHRAWLISTGYPEREPAARIERARMRLARVRQRLEVAVETPALLVPLLKIEAPMVPLPEHPEVFSTFDRRGFQQAVQRGIDYIHAGDCFQVNLSQRLLAKANGPSFDLYLRLRERNPAPFMGYFDMGDSQILSASPERFLRVDGRHVETRPIKGTRPRGATPAEDAAIAAELAAAPKDRAENVMIVDLLRNDLGRVCEYGSVRVPVVCQLETFEFVHHLVSEVRGTLAPGKSVVDLLRASFPGGSVTGAPKVRSMEIIAELEPTARGPYCGSLGYLGFNGQADTNILIRTITAKGGWLQFPVGGGIVADSDPSREYEETLHKAKGLLRSLDV